MRLKSYFAATVEAALNLARQELGPEAMLVDSRRTGPDSRHLGDYEVVCAVFPETTPANAPALPAAPRNPAPAAPYRAQSIDKLSQEVSELKRYMERMATTMSHAGTGFNNLRAHPELADSFALLSAAEIDPAICHEIVRKLGEAAENADLNSLLAAEVDRRLAVDSRLGRSGARQAVMALVGPPGCGKTTTLVKLAAQYGLATRRPTQILSLDTYRVGAADQLRSYAAILGIGFQLLETTAALAQSLEEHRQKDLILIDTPGFGRHDLDGAEDMARFISTHPEIDTHLVLAASTKAADLTKTAELYRVFRPDKLLFTKLDETTTFGPILNLIAQTGKPVSFMAYGQQIPEDLESAAKPTLVELILRKEARGENLNSAMAAA
jgi:flagellar biosynthesis protein FlhF